MSSHNQAFDLIRGDNIRSYHNTLVTAKTSSETEETPQKSSAAGTSYAAASDHNLKQINIDNDEANHLRSTSTNTTTPELLIPHKQLQQLPPGVHLASDSKQNDNDQQKSRDIDHLIGINSELDRTGRPLSRRVKFKSLLESAVINESDEITTSADKYDSNKQQSTNSGQELIDLTSLNGSSSSTGYCDTGVIGFNLNGKSAKQKINISKYDLSAHRQVYLNETIIEENPEDGEINDNSDYSDLGHEHDNFFDDYAADVIDSDDEITNDDLNASNNISKSPSHHRLKSAPRFYEILYRRLKNLGTDLTSRITNRSSSTTISYTAYEDTHAASISSRGVRKYRRLKKHKNPEQNFRGSYRYSRFSIVMTVFRKLLSFLVQRSTLALFGAFLIHVTLGTIYTLSNINSYLTSYMRKHGSPSATYGGSMWISSSYAVGQGISMVLGGLIERRFSARVSCIIGCALHSMSIMSTSKSIDYGQLAVLLTYGFLPGFGCGLAYMTPMSNGFGWFPNRKGLVAGVILAGFGIGTFVFNMAQTAYVNPDNLSPPKDANGYFTQDAILDNVPHLFTFLGTIYASMQFVGCCLLFKPPSPYDLSPANRTPVASDERPILADSEISFKKAIRSREFIVLFLVFGITNQGVLFVNSMLKEYGQIFIADDLYLAWTGSMASIANSLGRLVWGLAIDRYSFTQCFTSITTIFGSLIFIMPFEFVLSSKLLYLLCTLGIFGSFSGWMSTYPVHLSRIFGVKNSGMIYGLIFVSQSLGGIMTAFAAHYIIDRYSRFVPFFFVTFLEVLGLLIYHLFYLNK